MLCRKPILFYAMCGVLLPVFAGGGDLPAITITDNTNPKIAELYQQLQTIQEKIDALESERVGKLSENATAMRENEQRLENRALTSASTAATGLGGMQLGEGIAEKQADADAERDMRAYLATFRCEYGNGQSVTAGNEEIILPGGNELMDYYTEYKLIADRLKQTKAALGLRPGIESETLYDKAQSNLYQYSTTGITDGAYTSLSRALMDPDSKDANEWTAQKEKTKNKLTAGAVAAGIGVVGGIVGNAIINKDAPKEQSAQINSDYDAQVATVTNEQNEIQEQLNQAIAENAALVQEYNNQLQEHQNFVATKINYAPKDCAQLLSRYADTISKMSPIENYTDDVSGKEFPNLSEQQTLLAKCSGCVQKGGMFNPRTLECPCPEDKPVEKDGVCVEKIVEVIPEAQPIVEPIKEEQPNKTEKTESAITEPTIEKCPATGNALKSITDKDKVGDSCTSDIISQGTITKRKNGTCTCRATGCWTPYTPKNGQCVKDKSETATGTQNKNDYVDENGYCKPYKVTNWFFNKESNKQVSEYFDKICNEAAKAHSCKRKDLNTGRLTERDGDAFEYEWVCNADSDDYLAAQERINQRHANLAYENVCKNLEPGKVTKQGDITRKCVGLFENIDIPDYKTQLELAKAHIGTSAACSEKREARRNKSSNNPTGYYTNCNTTNDKEHYTFIFSGVSNNNTTPENFMRAACANYGVKFGAQGGELGRKQPYCSYTYKSIDNDPTCNKINTLAQKFGYTARIVRGTGCVLDTTGGVGGDKLAQSGMRSDEKITNLRTAFGIDNNMFANISTNMDEWLYDQMRINIANEMKRAGHSDPLVKFECFPAKSFALDKGVEFKLFGNTSGRNVLTCQANGHDIDFVFAQLGRSTKRRANASQEGLTCIFGSNGKYDGRQCWGVTEDDCKKLDAAIKENAKTCSQCGAKWDTDIGGCTLTKSTKVEKTNKGLEIAGNIALIAGGAVLTVMSGGMAMPMLVTELALMGVEITGATVAAVEEKHMRNVANEFLAKTQYCHDAECAQQLLNDTEVHRILNLESNLDEKQSKIIDDKLAELLRVIPADAPLYVALVNETENKQNCNFWRNATAQCEWAQFVHAWANVAQFASLGVALGRSAVRFINARKAIIEVAEQTTKKMTRAQAKRIGEIDKEINKIEGVTPGRRTAKQAEDLKKLRQERNTILNKVGTKDADELARMQKAAYNPELEKAQSDYQKLLKEREALAQRVGTNRAPGKVELQDIDRRIANQEKKLKDLGADVDPVEPLWKGDGNASTPKKNETKNAPKDTGTGTPKPAETGTGVASTTTQSKVRAKLGDKTNAAIEDIKSGKQKQLQIPTSRLTDDEWKVLKEELSKEGLEVSEVPGNAWHYVKKADKVDVVKPVPKATANVENSAGVGNTARDVSDGASSAGNTAKKTGDVADAARNSDKADDVANVVAEVESSAFRRATSILNSETDYIGAVRDQQLTDFAMDYLDDASKATTEAMEKSAWLKYHQKVVDYLATKFDRAKALRIASQRRQIYMSIIANDKNLSDKALKWKNLSAGEKQDFMQTLVDRFSQIHCNGHSCNVNVTWSGVGGETRYAEGGNITISLNSGHVYDASHKLINISPNTSLDDAMTALAHEHAHSIVLNAPAQSSIDERFTRMAIVHGEDENGVTSVEIFGGRLVSKNGNYQKLLTEQEGFLVGENVGKNFERDLRQMISKSGAGTKASTTFSPVTSAGRNAARNAIPSDFSPVAKEYINQINDIGKTRDYVVIKGVGKRNTASPLTRKENDYVNQLLEGRNDLIVRPITQGDGTGGILGANKIIVQKTDDMFSVETSTGIDLVRRLTTKPVDNLRGKSITTINGKPVFLEPLDNGGLIGNIEGRPVVVVNYNGHKIPFYTSSGKAGKLKVPTGKWEVFFGFGKDNTGFRWLNKADIDSIVDHYGSPELKKIAEALDNVIGDQRNLEDVFQTISRKIYNGIGNVASYDGPVASEDFINSMLDFVPVNRGDNRIFSNIEHVKSYFK